MRYFDSHAHYWDDRFATEYDGGVDGLIDTLLAESVSGIVNVGTNIQTSLLSIRQAQKHKGMYAAAGIHPSDCEDVVLADAISALKQLFSEPSYPLVAIGEIGLDYYWKPFDKEKQKACFRAQMQLAEELSMPVIIHDREAHGDCFDMACAFPRVKGVFHSYSGSAEMAKDLCRRGYMISFSGTVSFKNARSVKEAAADLPRENVLIETDAPYLAPHPMRGRMNHSGYLCHTAAALAEVWQTTPEEVARITEENARRFFGIPMTL